MVRTLSPITVTIRAGDGSPIACGVIYSVASAGRITKRWSGADG